MGKYWYNDNGKWRIGDDNDDLIVAILCGIFFLLFIILLFLFRLLIKVIKYVFSLIKRHRHEKPLKILLIGGIIAVSVIAIFEIGKSYIGHWGNFETPVTDSVGIDTTAEEQNLVIDSAMVEQEEAADSSSDDQEDSLEGNLLGVWTYSYFMRWEKLCVLNKNGNGYFAIILIPSAVDEEAGKLTTIEEEESFKWKIDEGCLIIEPESGKKQSYKLSDSGPLNNCPTNYCDGDDGDCSWIKSNGVYPNTPDGYANIHREPNSSSRVIGKLMRGGEPALSYESESEGGWLKIKLHDITGYVEKSQVKVQ